MDWFKSIANWLKRKFGRKRKRTSPKIIKRWYGAKCAILEIERNTRGAYATYRIILTDEGCDYLVTLDTLRELEGEMVGKFDNEPIFLRSHPHPTGSTHRFAFFRIRRGSGNAACLACWDMDLQFQGGSLAASELAPKRTINTAVLRLLKLDSIPRLSEEIENVDWAGLVGAIARGYYPHHQINAVAVNFVPSDRKVVKEI